MAKDKGVVPFHKFLRYRSRRDRLLEDAKVVEGAGLCEEAGLLASLTDGDFQGWESPAAMLEDVVADIRADTVQPTAAIVILYSPPDTTNPGKIHEQIPFYSMGLSRVELLGLLADMIRRMP